MSIRYSEFGGIGLRSARGRLRRGVGALPSNLQAAQNLRDMAAQLRAAGQEAQALGMEAQARQIETASQAAVAASYDTAAAARAEEEATLAANKAFFEKIEAQRAAQGGGALTSSSAPAPTTPSTQYVTRQYGATTVYGGPATGNWVRDPVTGEFHEVPAGQAAGSSISAGATGLFAPQQQVLPPGQSLQQAVTQGAVPASGGYRPGAITQSVQQQQLMAALARGQQPDLMASILGPPPQAQKPSSKLPLVAGGLALAAILGAIVYSAGPRANPPPLWRVRPRSRRGRGVF